MTGPTSGAELRRLSRGRTTSRHVNVAQSGTTTWAPAVRSSSARGALPTEDAALVLLFGLVVRGQIRLRRLDGWRQIPGHCVSREPAA